jgi:hypothetical protein
LNVVKGEPRNQSRRRPPRLQVDLIEASLPDAAIDNGHLL